MSIEDVLKATDWKLLRKQKIDLVDACNHGWDFEGLLNFIDAIQDATSAAGFPVYREKRGAIVRRYPAFGVWGPLANNAAAWILGPDGKVQRFDSEIAAQVCADEYSVINNLLGTPHAFRVEQLRDGGQGRVVYEVTGYRSQDEFDGRQFCGIEGSLCSKRDAMKIGRASLAEYPIVKVRSNDLEFIEILRR